MFEPSTAIIVGFVVYGIINILQITWIAILHARVKDLKSQVDALTSTL